MKFEYPDQLPVSAAREAIANAVRSSQVVDHRGRDRVRQDHAAAEDPARTARGSHGKRIAHTQPRRIAARTVARSGSRSRCGVELGEFEIGYQVRFTRRKLTAKPRGSR
jgi:ATP-dependent helicase HrpA